jgi:hypothetical protein
MLGAIGTHIVNKEFLMLAVASAIAVAAFWRAWLGRAEVKQLLLTLRPNK